MSYKSTLTFILFVFANFIFLLFNTTHYLSLDILFLTLFCIISFVIFHHINSAELDLMMSNYLIFNYLFFFISPLIQLNLIDKSDTLPNTMPFNYGGIALAIISIIIFNIIFFISLKFFRKKSYPNKNDFNSFEGNQFLKYKNSALIILAISFIILPVVFNYLISSFHKQNFEEYSQINTLIINKFILFLPIFSAAYYAKYKNKFGIHLLCLSIIILLIYKNPFFEKRNALGPIYLTLFFFLRPKWFNSNLKNLSILMLILVVLFPLTAIITHRTPGESFSSNVEYLDIVMNSFTSLHYDAFSNLVAAISYFQNMDITYGKQLTGSILFFVPKDIWITKPLSSGLEIGNYLMGYYNMWFNNLSMPLIGEGWMNFGFLGVILFAVILAFMVNFFKSWFFSSEFPKQIAAVYFSFHLIFLLRGDLTNGIAYYIGPFLAFYVVPNLMLKISKIKNV